MRLFKRRITSTVADLMVETLVASGVRRVYGLPGDSLNGFTDSIRREDRIEWQHVRHEEASAFAAGGEAAITGELAVCAASAGPGNLHLINGLFDANRSRVPVLAIAAHIPREEIGRGYFQETHPEQLFRECSVYCELVGVAEQLPGVLEIAMRAALERRGVGVIVVPGEVFLEKVGDRTPAHPIRATSPVIRPSDEELDAAAKALNASERTTILAGAGCQGAHDEVVELARALQAPIVHALRGKEHVEYENPFDVGMTGLLGFASGYRAMEHCDTLLILGSGFPYRDFYPDDVKVIQVDVRGEEIGRRVAVDIPLVGTVKDTAEALSPRLSDARDSTHLDRMTAHYKRARKRLDALQRERHDRGPLHPQSVTAALDRIAAEDAIFLADVGTPTIWVARHLQMNGRRRLLGSFTHGSMANALPQAIGAQACQPGRQVITLSGDGGVAMLLGELITLHQLDLPVKVVVFNNGALSFVELEMKAAGIVTFATDLDNPSFAEVARAIGLHGVRVEQPSELETGLHDALAHDGPALIEVMIEPQELSIPPNVTLDQMRGFTLYAARSIFSGNGDEVVQLAKTNIRQLGRE